MATKSCLGVLASSWMHGAGEHQCGVWCVMTTCTYAAMSGMYLTFILSKSDFMLNNWIDKHASASLGTSLTARNYYEV